jgi:hypothetical protein
MKMKLFAWLIAGCLAGLAVGCVSTLDGHTKAAVPFQKDKIEGRYERPVEQIYVAAKKVLAFNGVLTGENTIQNILQAKVNTRTVWVKVDQVDPRVSRVIVQVRTKGGAGDIDMAAELEKQIALQLR